MEETWSDIVCLNMNVDSTKFFTESEGSERRRKERRLQVCLSHATPLIFSHTAWSARFSRAVSSQWSWSRCLPCNVFISLEALATDILGAPKVLSESMRTNNLERERERDCTCWPPVSVWVLCCVCPPDWYEAALLIQAYTQGQCSYSLSFMFFDFLPRVTLPSRSIPSIRLATAHIQL